MLMPAVLLIAMRVFCSFEWLGPKPCSGMSFYVVEIFFGFAVLTKLSYQGSAIEKGTLRAGTLIDVGGNQSL
jgi:hypothetical protein